MSDDDLILFQNALLKVIQYSPLNNPTLCRGILNDELNTKSGLPSIKERVNALIAVVNKGVPNKLIYFANKNGLYQHILLTKIEKELMIDEGLSQEMARWALNIWISSLQTQYGWSVATKNQYGKIYPYKKIDLDKQVDLVELEVIKVKRQRNIVIIVLFLILSGSSLFIYTQYQKIIELKLLKDEETTILKKDNAKEISNLKEKHTKDITSLLAENTKQIESLKEKNAREIATITDLSFISISGSSLPKSLTPNQEESFTGYLSTKDKKEVYYHIFVKKKSDFEIKLFDVDSKADVDLETYSLSSDGKGYPNLISNNPLTVQGQKVSRGEPVEIIKPTLDSGNYIVRIWLHNNMNTSYKLIIRRVPID